MASHISPTWGADRGSCSRIHGTFHHRNIIHGDLRCMNDLLDQLAHRVANVIQNGLTVGLIPRHHTCSLRGFCGLFLFPLGNCRRPLDESLCGPVGFLKDHLPLGNSGPNISSTKLSPSSGIGSCLRSSLDKDSPRLTTDSSKRIPYGRGSSP